MEKAFSSGLSSALAGGAETIVACATAPGRGALAVVRMSGPAVESIARTVCGIAALGGERTSHLVRIVGRKGEEIDRAIAISYRAPKSYTGEDVVELIVHGSSFVVRETVGSCVAAGARPAEPGEFTRRAVANGKMDLLQAEAVDDLIWAETEWQARNARRQLQGALSAEVGKLREELVGLLAMLEVGLDFSEAEEGVDPKECWLRLARCRKIVDGLLQRSEVGEKIREGVRLAIIGPPNAGKSTLFNWLIGEDRAIVSREPGTTRDVVEADVEIAGVRVVVRDTAGIRETDQPIEQEGVTRARAAVADSNLVVFLWPAEGEVDDLMWDVAGGVPTIKVRSKADLVEDSHCEKESAWLWISCVDGSGLEELREDISRRIREGIQGVEGEVAISQRHRVALEAAKCELEACDLKEPELAVEGLRWASEAIEELMGGVGNEEVLDGVFARFCLGK